MSGLNFHTTFYEAFLYKSALRSFSPFTVRLCKFFGKEYRRKSKMLMKLTTGVNFTNILGAAILKVNCFAELSLT